MPPSSAEQIGWYEKSKADFSHFLLIFFGMLLRESQHRLRQNQIKNALFRFGKFGNLFFDRIPFETGHLINLILYVVPVLLVQGRMQMSGGFRHSRIICSSAERNIG